ATLVLDGHSGLGVPNAHRAMDRVIDKAQEVGIALATIRRSNHFGMAGLIAERASERALIGYAASSGPSRIAPFRGARPVFGTSPFAVAVPTGTSVPIVVDMATSVVARAKIIMADRAGRASPRAGQWTRTAGPPRIRTGRCTAPSCHSPGRRDLR